MTPQTLENFKLVSVIPPAAVVDNAAFTTAEVDTVGWDFARFVVYFGAIDIAATVLKVTESDTTGSGHVEIDATDFSDATQTDINGGALALPSADDDNKFFVIDIDLRGRKRFLDLNLTGGDGSAGAYAAAWCELYRGETLPRTEAGRGVAQMVSI